MWAGMKVLDSYPHWSYFMPMTAMGRPTRFEPEICAQAHNYCLLGATNDELADSSACIRARSTVGSPSAPISPTP